MFPLFHSGFQKHTPVSLPSHRATSAICTYSPFPNRCASPESPQSDCLEGSNTAICSGKSDEMDHRLSLEVARALDPEAMLRAFATDKPGLMAVLCRHEVPDSSGRRCALCGKCLHRDITTEGPCAICQDCNKMLLAGECCAQTSALMM